MLVFADPKELTPKWTPYLTPTAYSGCDKLSMNGKTQDDLTENPLDGNCLSDSELSNESDSLSSTDNGKNELRPAGLEPAAFGLGNQRSIHLSYERKNLRFAVILTERAAISRGYKPAMKKIPQTCFLNHFIGYLPS